MSAQRPAAFYAEWFKRTFSPAFKRTGLVNLAVGIGLGLVAWRWPTLGGLGTTLRWLLPLVAFASFFVYQWFRAPLEMMSEVQLKLSATEVRAQSAEEQVRETRDCQAIADFLTEQHEYDTHRPLLHN